MDFRYKHLQHTNIHLQLVDWQMAENCRKVSWHFGRKNLFGQTTEVEQPLFFWTRDNNSNLRRFRSKSWDLIKSDEYDPVQPI